MSTSGTTDQFDISESSEIWAPVVGYEGLYEVSSFGRVRSVARIVEGRWGLVARKGVMLSLQKANGRYTKVTLSKDGVMTQHQVHRLVLLAFIGEPPEGFECDHVDFDINNNVLTNLRWISKNDNLHRRKSIKLTQDLIKQIKREFDSGTPRQEIADKFNISIGHVYAVARHKQWKELA
jgi:hypothetical protein